LDKQGFEFITAVCLLTLALGQHPASVSATLRVCLFYLLLVSSEGRIL